MSIDELIELGRARQACIPNSMAPNRSPIDYLTPEEQQQLHLLKLQLPSYAVERQAAQQRLARKRGG